MLASELVAEGADVEFADLYEFCELQAAQFDDKGSEEGSWITIGGGAGPHGEQHSGGFPVLVDKDGTIIGGGGPKEIKGVHVSKVGDVFDKLNAGEPVKPETPKPTEPVSTKQGLSAEEEHTLFDQAKSGDKAAINRIVTANQGLIGTVAKKYAGKLPHDELMQIGNLALLENAIPKYDPEKGKFSTHATWWIRSAMTDATRKGAKLAKITKGLPQKKDEEKSAEGSIPDTKTKTPAAIAETKDATKKMLSVLTGMDERSAKILKMRYGLGGTDKLGQKEIGDKLGLTKARVQQLEAEALKEMQKKMGAMFSEVWPSFVDPDFAQMYFAEFSQIIHDNPEDAAAETNTEPSDAQKESANYEVGKFRWNGLVIAIENPKGSVRKGKSWSQVMASHYGYVKGVGASESDGDAPDVFIGPDLESDRVFVVNQNKQDGSWDEHKCMIGFPSEESAVAAYKSNYPSDWTGLGSVTAMSLDEFKAWLKEGDTSKPVFSELLACGCDPEFAARFATRHHRLKKADLQHMAKVTPEKIVAAKKLWNKVVPLAKRKKLARLAAATFGGAGSGDYGHGGRAGEVGGSSKESDSVKSTPAPKLSEKAQRAKDNHKLIDKTVQ